MSAFEDTRSDQIASIQFSQNLLIDWMRKNTLDGMSIQQSLWVFSRFETFTISTPWGQSGIDMFKMFNAGAIPTLYYCLCRVQPDDMTESYHWITPERLDWVKSRIEEYIGADAASYIASLP